MSASQCLKHQSPDEADDPCVYCLLEDLQRKTSMGRKSGADEEMLRMAVNHVHQACKNRLMLRKAMLKG